MQRLTLMTAGALLLGFGGFVYDSAVAQTPASCSSREVSIYFDKDTTEFNKFSQQLVERVATEAKACGARQVVAEVKSGPDRAQAVSHAFQDLGVKVIWLATRTKRLPENGRRCSGRPRRQAAPAIG
jgi:hypothetical protein